MSKFGFGLGAPVMGPLAGFGANNGRVMQSRKGGRDDDEYFRKLMASLETPVPEDFRQPYNPPAPMPAPSPQVAPEQPMPDQPIKAPKDRGMFGRFVGGLGKAAGKAGEFAMFGPVGMQIRADHRRGEEKAEQKTAEEEARRQQMLQQFAGMEGLTPQQQMLIRNGFGVEQLAEQQFAPSAAAEYGFQNVPGVGLVKTDPRAGSAEIAMPATPGYEQTTLADGVYEYIPGRPETIRKLGDAPVRSPGVNVNVNGFGGGAQSLAEIPVGQPVPEDLLGGINLPADTYAVRANNAAGFEFATIPGSATARKAESGEQAKGGRTYTLGSLIGSYSTLAKNKAITARGNSALDNAAAMYSGTTVGQMQDKLGGEVGQLANAEARDTIQGLSMKALMDMISMSDVSAKAMDSDAEMKAWLGAIKSDNYESALTKLHVLDLSFGSGQELERAYADGTIDLNIYQYVTNRVNSDPMVKQMLDKADRYAALSTAVGQGNLTTGERQSMQDLAGLVAPDGSAVTEDDIQETMAATGMTREQIITRLRGQ